VPPRPYVLLSCAISADGYLDDASPERLILSGPADLDRVDEVRAGCDAILVGAQTVRADNPRLLIRDPRRSARRAARGLPGHPARVTLTATGDLDPAARFFAPGAPRLLPSQLEMTMNVMAHSLVYWTQDLFDAGLLRDGSKVFAVTSAGSTRVAPTYGAVSAAKAALEAHVRQLSYELTPFGIAVNAIRAGVTLTPALRKIPGYERIVEHVVDVNPAHRLTTTQDVAEAIGLLSDAPSAWMTGNIVGVDGGEYFSS